MDGRRALIQRASTTRVNRVKVMETSRPAVGISASNLAALVNSCSLPAGNMIIVNRSTKTQDCEQVCMNVGRRHLDTESDI
jgi:hypothetical protein